MFYGNFGKRSPTVIILSLLHLAKNCRLCSFIFFGTYVQPYKAHSVPYSTISMVYIYFIIYFIMSAQKYNFGPSHEQEFTMAYMNIKCI